jgi:hypothetical protein
MRTRPAREPLEGEASRGDAGRRFSVSGRRDARKTFSSLAIVPNESADDALMSVSDSVNSAFNRESGDRGGRGDATDRV